MKPVQFLIVSLVLLFGIVFHAFAVSTASSSSMEQNLPKGCFYVEGQAYIEGNDLALARQKAIRDGLNIAAMRKGVKVYSNTSVKGYTIESHSAQYGTKASISNFELVDESHEDSNYVVFLKVCTSNDPSICPNYVGGDYQNKIVVSTPLFEYDYARQANDISNLIQGYQSELLRRLYELGWKNIELVNTGASIWPNLGEEYINWNEYQTALRPLQEETGAQLVLFPKILSLASEQTNRDLLEQGLNSLKTFFDGELEDNRRQLEVEWFLIDINEGKLLKRKRHGFTMEGDVWVGRDKPFGTAAFYDTAVGRVFDQLLAEQAEAIYKSSRCRPLVGEILETRGKEVVFRIGKNSGLESGDQLVIYGRQGMPIRQLANKFDIGTRNEVTGVVTVKKVHAEFAVGKLESSHYPVFAGDFVKSW